jgi:hypothetical protein
VTSVDTAGTQGSVTWNANGSFTYQPAGDFAGTDGFAYALGDGRGGVATGRVSITVHPVNDAPQHTVPAAQTIDEDAPLVFAAAAGNAIAVADVDAGSGLLQQTLTATQGTITLSRIFGLTFTAGDGIGDATMTFSGTQADINAALDGLVFQPAAHYSGTGGRLVILTNDNGLSGSGGAKSDSDTITITVNAVNDPPIHSAPATQVTTEGVDILFSTTRNNVISVSDVDAGSSLLEQTLSVAHGTLTLSRTTGLTFLAGDGTGDAAMQFRGSVANINAALAGMRYRPAPGYSGLDSLQITTNDQGYSGSGGAKTDADAVSLSVNAVNHPPVHTLPASAAIDEDTSLVFGTATGNAISVADPDAGAAVVRQTLQAVNGTLSLGGTAGLTFLAGDGTDDALLVFTGTVADVNVALDGLTFAPLPEFYSSGLIQIRTEDFGWTGEGGPASDSDTLFVTVNAVNDAPQQTVPGRQVTDADMALVFSAAVGNAVSVSDVDACDRLVQQTFIASHGTLTLSALAGLTFALGDGTADAAMTFTGTLADVNAALEGMLFTPDAGYAGVDAQVEITTDDRGNVGSGGSLSDTDVIPITVRGLEVEQFSPTGTGFVIRFSRDLALAQLNLYDQGGTLGPADVILAGPGGAVRGSLVVDSGLRQATFIKTDGLLEPGSYSATVISGVSAFRDTSGNSLDGDADGVPGGDFVDVFTVSAPAANTVTVSLPNFTRGYGQLVNLPANVLTAGLPLTVSNGMGVTAVELAVQYDPALLSISAFVLDAAVASRAAYTLDISISGRAVLTITAATGLADAAGQLTVGSFTAQVPNNAPYLGKHVLDITDLRVLDNSPTPAELPAFDDDAIHVAAFFGDANGDGAYNSPDATLVRRIIGQLHTGLAAYQLADPALIVDISQNGLIQSNDTTNIRRVAGHVAVPNIPALPDGLQKPDPRGADPLVYIPRDLAGTPGSTVTVPVRLQVTERAGITLSGFEVLIEYDPSHLTVTGSELGELLSGTDVSGSLTHPARGQLIYTASALHGTGLLAWGTVGDLFTVTFTIAKAAPAGTSVLNLRSGLGSTATAVFDAQLNSLVLSPAPTDSSADGVDGLLTIRGAQPAWGFPEVNTKHPSKNDTAVLSPIALREDVLSGSERRHYSRTSPKLDAPHALTATSLSLRPSSFVPSLVDEISDELAGWRVKPGLYEQDGILDAVFAHLGQEEGSIGREIAGTPAARR